MTKRSAVKAKGKKTVPFKWVLKSKEEADGLFRLKSMNAVKGYMQVSVVDLKYSFYPVLLYTSTRTLIGLALYHEDEGWVAELCDV